MSLSVHVDNKNKDILILAEVLPQGLDDFTITAEAKYPINITQSGKYIMLNLHYNGSNSFLFINAVKMYQIKAKDSKIKPYSLCFGNRKTSTYFTIDNIKKTRLKGRAIVFSVDYNAIDTSDILDNHRNLMKETCNRKEYLGLVTKSLQDY